MERWIDQGPETQVVVPDDIVTEVDATSTDAQVPSAKCLNTMAGDVEAALAAINTGPREFWNGDISTGVTFFDYDGTPLHHFSQEAALAAINTGPREFWNGDISTGVTFFDYDGTPLHHFSQEAAASMQTLPPLPTHEGLICQEWNYTMQEVKTIAAQGCCVHVGATYTTDDGKTRFYVDVYDPSVCSVTIGFAQSASNGVTIDWGDGSSPETVAGTQTVSATHLYAPGSYPAQYVISLEVTSGSLTLTSSSGNLLCTSIYQYGNNGGDNIRRDSTITKVEVGAGCATIGQFAFFRMHKLESVTIPNTVTTIRGTYNQVFSTSTSLKALILPRSLTDVGTSIFDATAIELVSVPPGMPWPNEAFTKVPRLQCMSVPGVAAIANYSFYNCTSLRTIHFADGTQSLGNYVFSGCSSLKEVKLPNSLRTVGNYCFEACSVLNEIDIPEGVTALGNYAFINCSRLIRIGIPSTLESVGEYAFRSCNALVSVAFPDTVSINPYSLFNGCWALARVTLPSSGLTWIGSDMFYGCGYLTSITVPASVASVGTNAWAQCYRLATFDFRRLAAVPTLQAVNAFYQTPTTREIIVPDALYEEWKAANNWNSSTYGIVDSIVKASESSLGPLT